MSELSSLMACGKSESGSLAPHAAITLVRQLEGEQSVCRVGGSVTAESNKRLSNSEQGIYHLTYILTVNSLFISYKRRRHFCISDISYNAD